MTENFHGQAAREAHALAIGKVVMAWNEYQELLAEIFASFFDPGHWGLSLTAWHALNSDRSQRGMLRAVVMGKLPPEQAEAIELKWLLDQTDQLISSQRNTSTHAPLGSYTDEEGVHSILPFGMFGNRLAGRLAGRDILKEYALYEEQIRKMYTYAIQIQYNLSLKRTSKPTELVRPTLIRQTPLT
jgi:hypothetical protein